MCEFCHKHGDGKKWYLQAKNYAEDLVSDLRRRNFIIDFFSHPEHIEKGVAALERLERAPSFVRRAVCSSATRRSKQVHFGQVVPLEEIKEIFGFVNSVVRVPCICRYAKLGREVGFCYGASLGPGGGAMADLLRGLDDSFVHGPDHAGLEVLSPEEAMAAFTEHEKQGLCHTVWTFRTPFIGGVCNCDRADCLATQATVIHGLKVMFRAEYVAEMDPDRCTGCRACLRQCQFGALAYSGADRKAWVDQRACYGCGVCRAACAQGALTLKPREQVPVAAKTW